MNKLSAIDVKDDYIGKIVRKFESGTRGCKSISQCGNDWGYSFGSYQLTARWGNALNFFNKYYGSKYKTELQKVKYYGPDFESKKDPGMPYCTGMKILETLWKKEANLNPTLMENNERKYIQENFYEQALKNLSSFNPNFYNRAFQECIWSWSVHKSGRGAAKAAMEVLKSVNLNTISAEELFDKFYDYRYKVNKFNRYKKGLMNGSSEREVLRKYLNTPPLGFNGISTSKYNNVTTAIKEESSTFKNYTVKILADSLNVRSTPEIKNGPSNVVSSVKKNATFTIVDEKNGFGKLLSGLGWISISSKYVKKM